MPPISRRKWAALIRSTIAKNLLRIYGATVFVAQFKVENIAFSHDTNKILDCENFMLDFNRFSQITS
jgi:hypothetical protein